jgi:adenylate cyclase
MASPPGRSAHLKGHGGADAQPRPGPRGQGSRAVQRQLEHILESADFDASRRSREFLRFIVTETLAGRGEALTQAAIAVAVFGRRADFDPVVDPIVRIQAGRLRRSLERYYLLEGAQDVLRIELRRGSYLPVFRTVAPPDEAPSAPEAQPAASCAGDGWPVVALGDFEAPDGAAELGPVARRMSDELALELGRYGTVRILRHQGGRDLDPAHRDRARFAFAGRVEPAADGLRITAHLTDLASGQTVWGDDYLTAPGPGRWSGSPEDVARVIAARMGGEEGVVVRFLVAERRKRGARTLSPYDAFLLSCEFFYAGNPHTFAAALDALRKVVQDEPENGLIWAQLARLCVANHTLEATDIPTSLEEAIVCAEQGVRADPSSRIARCLLAAMLLVKGELATGRAELEQALRQSPDSLVYLEIIGLLLVLMGDGDRGRDVCREALERNPHCMSHVWFALWVDHLRRGELEEAHRAALEHRDPTFFIRSVMRACSLGLLGRVEEGRVELAVLLARKPDFASRGRRLLGHYVRFPEAMDRIVEGLEKVGLRLE